MASRWRNSKEYKPSFSSFLKEMDVAAGNPSAAMGPAERARALGLQSNGKGGYIDPGSGQVVAQTVNGELVFYSQNRATGGAVSDSSGGAALVSDQPSWADPVTGMVTTPPGRPEGPEELASVPDPVPAKAPHGYNSFMVQQKQQMYAQDAMQQQQMPGDMALDGATGDAPEQPIGANGQLPVQDPGMVQQENYGPEDLLVRTKGQAPVPTFHGMMDRIRNNRMSQTPPNEEPLGGGSNPVERKAAQKKVDSVQVPTPPTKLTQEVVNDEVDMLSQIRSAASERYRESLTKTQNLENQLQRNFEPFMQMVGQLPPEIQSKLNPFLLSMYNPSGYDNNAGNALSRQEQRAMEKFKEELINLDGRMDGHPSAQKSRDFVNSRRIFKDHVTDDMITALQKALPKGHRFKGKSNFKRLKRIVEQGGLDAYTGLPLDLNSSNWEHTIPNSSRYFPDLSDEEKDELLKHVDSDDNMVEINKAPNQQKLKKSMQELYETVIDPDSNLTDEELDFRTDSIDKERRGLKQKSTDLTESLFGEDGMLRGDMNLEDFQSIMDSVDTETTGVKEALTEGLKKLDKDGLLDKKPGKLDERDKIRREALVKMKNAIAGFKSKSLGAIQKKLGMSETIRDVKDERGTGLGHGDIVSAVVKSLIGKSSDDQRTSVTGFNDLLKSVSDITRKANSGGRLRDAGARSDVGFDQYSTMVKGLVELINPDLLDSEEFGDLKNWMGLFDGSDERKETYRTGGLRALKRLMMEDVDMDEDDDDDMMGGQMDIYEINDLIKEIIKMNSGNTFDKFMNQ